MWMQRGIQFSRSPCWMMLDDVAWAWSFMIVSKAFCWIWLYIGQLYWICWGCCMLRSPGFNVKLLHLAAMSMYVYYCVYICVCVSLSLLGDCTPPKTIYLFLLVEEKHTEWKAVRCLSRCPDDVFGIIPILLQVCNNEFNLQIRPPRETQVGHIQRKSFW
jgi:hypothetical protein